MNVQQIQDIMKTQMIFSAGVGSSWSGLRNVVVMSLYDKLVQTYPFWSAYIKLPCCRRPTKRLDADVILNSSKQIQCEIEFERSVLEKSGRNGNYSNAFQTRMDAVIHTVSKVPAISHLLSISNHDYLPYEFNPIKVESDVYFQLIEIKHTDGSIEGLKFKLFCYEHDSTFLQAYVESCNAGYERHINNKLGTSLFFFDMILATKNKQSIQNPLPSSHIVFTKHKFHTSRTFDNVFFDKKEEVQRHTEFFLKRKDWYEKKGIPHTLGFMFHGQPGCGKTSTIKAIANVGRRHIINIHLSEIKSKEQLNHLFFNDEIQVYDGTKAERFTIPVNERMYVIEDIDAMGDTVLRREWKRPEPATKKKEPKLDEFGMPLLQEEEKNPIDLSFLLNLLDGTLESSGRILAITTNFPERIDRALIRPGRIDMILQFKKCSITILKEMVESFYDIKIEDTVLNDKSLQEKWSPAEVNQILFRNFNSMENAIYELGNINSNELYGFIVDTPNTTS